MSSVDGSVINFGAMHLGDLLFLTLGVVIVAVIVVVIVAFRRGCGRCGGCGGPAGAGQSGRRVIGGNGSLGGLRDLQIGTGAGTGAATCLRVIVTSSWLLLPATIIIVIVDVIVVVLLRAAYITCNYK